MVQKENNHGGDQSLSERTVDQRTGVDKFARRCFLQAASAVSIASLLPRRGRGAPTGDITLLGGFESDLEGWQTNGGNELERISDDEFAGSATQGSHALAVGTDGDAYPMIENKKRIRRADFDDSPFLMADVVPVVADTDSDIVFTFRYHHADAPPDSKGNTQSRQEKPTLVEESPEIRVPQFLQSQIHWDMSELDESTRSKPRRLEIAWYPVDHPPVGGPRGGGSGAFDYRGYTLFDNIHLSDVPTDLSRGALQDKLRQLRLDRGRIVKVETDELSKTFESGRFLFGDGESVPYQFEVSESDQFKYAIDGETFELGGGWS